MQWEVTAKIFDQDQLSHFWWFVCERQLIWKRRFLDRIPFPWTQDFILQTKHFTNIYRELDPGTQYAIWEILERNAPKKDKIFNLMIYRLFGKISTHQFLGFQELSEFESSEIIYLLKYIRDVEKEKIFTGAYQVSPYSELGGSNKIENIIILLARLHKNFDPFYKKMRETKTPKEAFLLLSSNYGFGSFLSYQVLLDLLYPLQVYNESAILSCPVDKWTYVCSGARKLLAEISNVNLQKRGRYLKIVQWLRKHQREEFERNGLTFPYIQNDKQIEKNISIFNIQNNLCQFGKYLKIKRGNLKSQRKYHPPSLYQGTQLVFSEFE